MSSISTEDVRTFASRAAKVAERRNRPAAALLLFVSSLWVAVGTYSGFATFQGFERLNWGTMAVILTVIAQIGAMSYQFVIEKLMTSHPANHRGLLVGGSAVVLFFGLIFHLVSLAGSVYFHRAASLVPEDKRLVEVYRGQLNSIAQSAEFNASVPLEELRSLGAQYLAKEEEEVRGEGITGKAAHGPYAESYRILAQAARNLEVVYQSPSLPTMPALSGGGTNDEAFFILQQYYISLPAVVRELGAKAGSGGNFEDWRRQLPRPAKPGFMPQRDAVVIDPRQIDIERAERVLRAYMDKFPARPIPFPTAVHGTPEEVVGGVMSVFYDLNAGDKVERSSAQAGLIGAGLTELLTIICNIAMLFASRAWRFRARATFLAELVSAVSYDLSLGGRSEQLETEVLVEHLRRYLEFEAVPQQLVENSDGLTLELDGDLDVIRLELRGAGCYHCLEMLVLLREGNLLRRGDAQQKYALQIGMIASWFRLFRNRIAGRVGREMPSSNRVVGSASRGGRVMASGVQEQETLDTLLKINPGN